jgi:hypothetical protein
MQGVVAALLVTATLAGIHPGDVITGAIQLDHATRAALPSPAFPGEEGWSFSQGAKNGLTEEFFTVAHLIETSH